MIFFRKQQLLQILNNHLISYASPLLLTYFWNFGFLSGLFLIIQLISGILLAMHYCSDIVLAFFSINHIMRDLNFGWLLRYLHANGASFFFIVVYLHISRALYYKSYIGNTEKSWFSGVCIYILMMAVAFIGYVLPWGQMSLWGATVITNLFSVLPILHYDISFWIWGGFSVGNPTLTRFFSLHYFLAFVLVGMACIHLILLHSKGSTNLLIGTLYNLIVEKIFFYPYLLIKDFVGFFLILIIYLIISFFFSNSLGHSDNYILANFLVTPTHIVPEWYFLPFYAVLRSFSNKALGVFLMGMCLCILFCLVFFFDITLYFFTIFYITNLSYWYHYFVNWFFFNFFCLGWVGVQVVEDVYIFLGQLCSLFYFLLLLLFSFNFSLLNSLLLFVSLCIFF